MPRCRGRGAPAADLPRGSAPDESASGDGSVLPGSGAVLSGSGRGGLGLGLGPLRRRRLEAQDQRSDVVWPALTARLVDQRPGSFVDIAKTQGSGHGRRRDGAAESVAAEQENVAYAQVDGELVETHRRLGAQGPAEDAAMRMNGRLLFREAPAAHHLGDQRMVVTHLCELSVPPKVGPAVADMDEVTDVRLKEDGGEGRAHAGVSAVTTSASEDGAVRPPRRRPTARGRRPRRRRASRRRGRWRPRRPAPRPCRHRRRRAAVPRRRHLHWSCGAVRYR